MKHLFSLALIFALAAPFTSFAQDAMYSKSEFEKILQTYNEVVVDMPGWNYKYSGNWLGTMQIVEDATLTFSRGRVVHSYDLKKVAFVQEEGNYVKLYFR